MKRYFPSLALSAIHAIQKERIGPAAPTAHNTFRNLTADSKNVVIFARKILGDKKHKTHQTQFIWTYSMIDDISTHVIYARLNPSGI